jgi:hypothetical protein
VADKPNEQGDSFVALFHREFETFFFFFFALITSLGDETW